MTRLTQRGYAPPRDHVVLTTGDLRLFDLAARLWSKGDPGPSVLEFRLDVLPSGAPPAQAEREVVWQHAEKAYRVTIPGPSRRRDRPRRRPASAAQSLPAFSTPSPRSRPAVPSRRPPPSSSPAAAGRSFTRAPSTGPRGAAVLRGGAGAGKSTLVGAAFASGLGVLADESLLVARDDACDLSAAVRDLTLRPDAAALLGLVSRTRFAFTGGEPKRRLDLFEGSRPALRRASLVAPILLGDRDADAGGSRPALRGGVPGGVSGGGDSAGAGGRKSRRGRAVLGADGRIPARRGAGPSGRGGSPRLPREVVSLLRGGRLRILLAHSYFLAYDAKQTRKMRPYPPLATLLTASVLRARGHDVRLFDAMLSKGESEFARCLERDPPRRRRPPRGQLQLPDEDVHDADARSRSRDDPPPRRPRGCRVAVERIRRRRTIPSSTSRPGADAVDPRRDGADASRAASTAWAAERRRASAGIAGLALPASGGLVHRTPPRPFVERPRRASAPGLGPRRRRALPRGLAEGPRPALVERRHDPRLPFQLQLVREAALRHALRAAEPGARRRRARGPEDARSAPTTSGSPTTSSA